MRYIGCSTHPAWAVMEAVLVSEMKGYARYVSEQPPYNLLDRRIENELIPLCQRYGIDIGLSEITYEATREEFLARPVDCVAVKGKEEPIVVYELLGPRDEAAKDVLAFGEACTAGFEQYRGRAFEAACESYERALALKPGDEAATQLLERCRVYAKDEPPVDWTGVVKLTTK